ncbi:MAG TPA: molybdenum cofactor biosynthesis protein MoaE [Sphingomicrobium sp.]|nr:molybdenum cofactor biosynthesis protein MoaE [Sphingomicrobium sp.]
MRVEARLEPNSFDPSSELDALLRDASGDGAVVSFVGIARPQSKRGGALNRLVLEHHPRLTLKSLRAIASEGGQRFAVSHVRVVHRCGEIAPGEAIVFVGASSPHRRAAFEAADYLMDRLKTDAVFWKREDGPGPSEWIEPTETDYAGRGRWE